MIRHPFRRRQLSPPFVLICICCCNVGLMAEQGAGDQRPNVVWIVADDLSPELGCYGYEGVSTPNIDRLATDGIRFNLAFSTAPVCSASRTAFQTGQYQTTVGGHHHDTRIKPTLPETIPTVTGLMRKAGYFVCNGRGLAKDTAKKAKSHLNFVYEDQHFFDGKDWSERAEGQPFFAQVQIKEPHRAFIARQHDYHDAKIPPYYPDHPITSADWGNYLASVEALDSKVGAVLDRLDAEQLAKNTLVMFFGDHGRPHVRDKQWLYDGGIRVPLLVRWPGKAASGSVDERMVSLMDLMPTTLAAAGVAVPANAKLMGADLFSEGWQGHAQIFAARDRCGEAVDRIRCVRNRRFKYIRNFHPDKPYLQHSSYKKLSYPVVTLMQVLHANGDWDSPLMAADRPKEELYDLQDDPDEMHNVAEDADYADQLVKLRGLMDDWIVETNDQGAIDESLTVDMEKLRAGKWKWFTSTMKKRGLSADVSDDAYLDWWRGELQIR